MSSKLWKNKQNLILLTTIDRLVYIFTCLLIHILFLTHTVKWNKIKFIPKQIGNNIISYVELNWEQK